MNIINELKKQKEVKTGILLKECLVFFAFSDAQFEENKTQLKDNEKYVSIGAGGYMPSSKIDDFRTGLKNIREWYNAEINSSKKIRKANILYELQNHEAFYTGDISDTLDSLGNEYTKTEVWAIYNKHYKYQEL